MVARGIIEPALDKSSVGYASMKFGLAIGASYVLKKCGFIHIYSNTRPDTATYFSQDNLTISDAKIGNIQKKPQNAC